MLEMKWNSDYYYYYYYIQQIQYTFKIYKTNEDYMASSCTLSIFNTIYEPIIHPSYNNVTAAIYCIGSCSKGAIGVWLALSVCGVSQHMYIYVHHAYLILDSNRQAWRIGLNVVQW